MKLLVTLVAVLGYGLWAYFANCYSLAVENPEMIATRAAIIQGTYAGILTFLNVFILEWLYRKLSAAGWVSYTTAATVTGATLFQYSMIVPIHVLNNTPNIVITLLPGFIIGTAFSTAYTLAYAKKIEPTV